jgi:hypothetical protein
MKKPRTKKNVVPRFDARERELLAKLARTLGSDNAFEAEAARGLIDSMLLKFGKTWSDLVELLSAGTVTVEPDLAGDIVGLGGSDPKARAGARGRIGERLARHRKNWNDFVHALYGAAPATWLGATPADPKRVNPLMLIIHMLKEYVALRDEHEYLMIALWILHTHVFRQFLITPRLALRSPVAGCGKTTMFDVVSKLAANAEKFDSITTAALYRLIDESHPTLLIDEADNLNLALAPSGRLRAVFNSGHRAGGTVAISERGGMRKFSTFAPLALALPDAMAGLPRTLNSRCITLHMQRARRTLRRFEPYRPDAALDACYAQILLWRNDVELEAPEMPEQLRNRIADNWRPLISIADSLGMGDEARAAAIAFAHAFQDADVRLLVLSDIRKVFDAGAVDRLTSNALLDALHGLDGSDWTEFRGIRGDQSPHKLKAGELASMMHEFGVKPRVIWPLNRTAKSVSARGYHRAQFAHAWHTYVDEEGVTTSRPGKARGLQLVGGDT